VTTVATVATTWMVTSGMKRFLLAEVAEAEARGIKVGQLRQLDAAKNITSQDKCV